MPALGRCIGMRVVLVLVLVAIARAAAAEPVLDQVVIVGQAAPGAPWQRGPTQARRDDGPRLAVVGLGHDGKQAVVFADAEVTLPGTRRSWASLGSVEVRWSLVEPHAWREGPATNGATSAYHSNVVTGGPHHGEWLGYDTITYFETPLADHARIIPAAAHPSDPAEDIYGGYGTMRYTVSVSVGHVILSTPGAEAVDTFGILPTVHRVSLRAGDDFIGWLTSYFLVPEVFGSAGPGANHQTERFTGADCADVLVGGARRWGKKLAYTSVAGLTKVTTRVSEAADYDEHGVSATPGAEIRGIRRGDLVRIDYGGEYAGATPRSWDHIGAIYEDRSDPAGPQHGGANGVLDGWDLVVHMGHPRLMVEPLTAQLPARLDVLRWK